MAVTADATLKVQIMAAMAETAGPAVAREERQLPVSAVLMEARAETRRASMQQAVPDRGRPQESSEKVPESFMQLEAVVGYTLLNRVEVLVVREAEETGLIYCLHQQEGERLRAHPGLRILAVVVVAG